MNCVVQSRPNRWYPSMYCRLLSIDDSYLREGPGKLHGFNSSVGRHSNFVSGVAPKLYDQSPFDQSELSKADSHSISSPVQ